MSTGIHPTRREALLWLAAALLLIPALGLLPLFDIDEGAFSEATREMLSSGDWWFTTLNGAPRFDKPILIYWLQLASVEAFGLNEFALRLPSALAGLAWIAVVGRFVAARVDQETGLLAAWIATTSFGVLVIAHAAIADALLNALLAAALLDAWRFLEEGRRGALLRMYAWIGLGVLTKGPIAALIPVAATLLYSATARRLREWVRAAFDPAGWALLVVLVAPWYAYALHRYGRAFVEGFFVRHNLQRFGGTLEGHSGSVAYYLVVVPALLLPWTALLVPTLAGARRDWTQGLRRYLWLWFGFVFVFFSASGTKLPHYALYGLTPLFILLALHRTDRGAGRWTLALPALLLVAMPALPWLIERWAAAASGTRVAYYAALGRQSLQAAHGWFYAVTVGAAGAGLIVLLMARWMPWRRLAVAAGLLALSIEYGVAPWLGDVISGPVKRAAQFVAVRPQNVVQWNLNVPSFSLYRRHVTESREPRPGELAITRADRLDPSVPVKVLFSEGGILVVERE